MSQPQGLALFDNEGESVVVLTDVPATLTEDEFYDLLLKYDEGVTQDALEYMFDCPNSGQPIMADELDDALGGAYPVVYQTINEWLATVVAWYSEIYEGDTGW
jgi:hypothetical protein